jgi:hypothetical protein
MAEVEKRGDRGSHRAIGVIARPCVALAALLAGSSCDGGGPQPARFASGASGTAPLLLRLDETFVYWIELTDLPAPGMEPDAPIRRLPKTSPGSPSSETIGSGLEVTASAGDVWWVEDQAALAVSHRDPGGTVTVVFQRDGASLAGLARNARFLYLTLFDPTAAEWQLDAIAAADGSAALLASQPAGSAEFGKVIADESDVYWTVTPPFGSSGTGEIRRLPVDGGPVETFETSASIPIQLVGGADTVYWFAAPMTGLFAPSGNLFAKPKGGGATVTLASAGSFRDMAADDRFVYWSEADRAIALDPIIKKVPVAGGDAVPFAAAAPGMVDARSLVADDRDLYWIEAASDSGPGPGAILRAPSR